MAGGRWRRGGRPGDFPLAMVSLRPPQTGGDKVHREKLIRRTRFLGDAHVSVSTLEDKEGLFLWLCLNLQNNRKKNTPHNSL